MSPALVDIWWVSPEDGQPEAFAYEFGMAFPRSSWDDVVKAFLRELDEQS